MTSPATYRCTACGREFGATSPAVVFGVHGVGPRSRLTCTSGSLVPVGPVTLPIARDDPNHESAPPRRRAITSESLRDVRYVGTGVALGLEVVTFEVLP